MASGWERGAPRALGRYVVFDEIAAGGMASVHVGRHLGPLGFCRTVAIKRLHAQFAKDPEFVAMFVDEARLAARVQHPNVVATLDVVTAPEELLLVMDYVHGETLSRLLHQLTDAGLISVEGKRVHIPDPAALESRMYEGGNGRDMARIA